MTARKVYWYGLSRIAQDLKITKLRVAKETDARIYLHKEAQVGLLQSTKFFNKDGNYENWRPTREEAVAMKLHLLKNQAKTATEDAKEIKACLAEFKAQENA